MCSSKRSAKLVDIVIEKGDADLGAQQIDGETVDDFVKGLAGSLGENIQLGRIVRFESADGLLDAYKHIQNERGVVGVLVELGGVDPADAKAREVAHDVALHIASAAPRWVTRDEVPADVIERERKIYESLAREEGKPEAGVAQDHRGQDQRLLQGQPGWRSRGAVIREGPEVDRRGARRRARGQCRGATLRASQDRRGVTRPHDHEGSC